MLNLSIFKTYDIRGVYPNELNEDTAYQIGRAFADFIPGQQIAVGRDMRVSSPALSDALIRGIVDQGKTAIDVGLISTDMIYFAVGQYGYDGGVMITASHNPGNYNGFKFCRELAKPISLETGLRQMYEKIVAGTYSLQSAVGGLLSVEKKDIRKDWVDYVLSFVDVKIFTPLKIVVDAGNGMAGHIFPEFEKGLQTADCKLQTTPMYFELDGNFPNHPPSPLEEENQKDLKARVIQEKADLGLIFDGDADRVFFIDDQGKMLQGTVMTAMIAQKLLEKRPESTILYNAICGRIVPETIESLGGKAIRTRVGHSLIKADMEQYGAIFAGEHSGHYYYKDNWNADSALISAAIMLELICESGEKLSALRKPFEKYVSSGEINSRVEDIPGTIQKIETAFSDGTIDHLDGLTINYPDWWFNLRASNTEPLLRLNIEAINDETLKEKAEKILELIRSN